jgi:hypothetical protein
MAAVIVIVRPQPSEVTVLTVTRDMVLPTTITGSYPRPLWFDRSLAGRSFKSALGDSLFREQYLDAVAGDSPRFFAVRRLRRLFRPRRETVFAQDCVVGLTGLEIAAK